MSNEAANKWSNASIDTQIVLRIAFSNVLSRPELVADYNEFKITCDGFDIHLFKFRIGYASFLLMLLEGIYDEFVVCDFNLQDGDGAHLDRTRITTQPTPARP